MALALALRNFTARWTMRTFITAAVACVWIITALASIITNNFTSLGAVTPVMMIVTGFLFGSKPNGNSSSSSTPPERKE